MKKNRTGLFETNIKKCQKCGNNIENPISQWQRFCNDCQNYSTNEGMKGGNEEMVIAKKKEKVVKEKVEKVEKVVKEKVPGKTIARQENSDKVVNFVRNELKVEGDEFFKVLSRAYNQEKHKK